MKKITVIIWMLFTAFNSDAQGIINSIFRQKATARKYSLEQLALLRTYKGYINKGYAIAKKGLGDIGGFTGGEYNLHGAYIASLKKVSPLVKKYPLVPEIIALQLKTLQIYTACWRQTDGMGEYSDDQRRYIKRVFADVLRDCSRILDELGELTTNGKLEMKDDERLQRIDHLHTDMLKSLRFSENFSLEVRQIGFSARTAAAGGATISSWYKSQQ